MPTTLQTRPAPRPIRPTQRIRHREHHNPLRGLTMARAVALVESYPRGEFADLMWTLGAPYVGIECADPDLSAIIGRRADALYEMDWNAKPMSGPRIDPHLAADQAAFIDTLAESIDGLEDVVEHLALAACRGYSHVEIIPTHTRDGIELRPVDHWNIVRDGLHGPWYYNPDALPVAATHLPDHYRIDPRRFIIREVRRPFGRIAIAKFVRSNLAERDWSAFAEIFGLPSGVVILPPDIPEDREAEFEYAARALAEGGSGSLPHGADYRPNPATTGRTGGPFRDFLDYLTEKLVLVGTGGKLTMLAQSGTGTLAGNAHADVWEQLARAEAVRISRLIQRALFEPLLRHHWPRHRPAAYWELAYRESVDADQVIADAATLHSAGYHIPAAQLAEKTGYTILDPDHRPTTPPSCRESPPTAPDHQTPPDTLQNRSDAPQSILEPLAPHSLPQIHTTLYHHIYTQLSHALDLQPIQNTTDDPQGLAAPLRGFAAASQSENNVNTAETDHPPLTTHSEAKEKKQTQDHIHNANCGTGQGGFAHSNKCAASKGTSREPRTKKPKPTTVDHARRDPRSQSEIVKHKEVMREALQRRDSGEGGILKVGALPESTLQKFREAGGPSSGEIQIEVNPQLLRHQDNQHGGGAERSRGQIPLTDEDFIKRLPLVMFDPDIIEAVERKGANGEDRFRFTRRIRDNHTAIIEVHVSKRKGVRAVPVTQIRNATIQTRPMEDHPPAITSITVVCVWSRPHTLP